jgi:hypothetical protein
LPNHHHNHPYHHSCLLQTYTAEQSEEAKKLTALALAHHRLHLPSYECDFVHHQLAHIAGELPLHPSSQWSMERFARYLLALIKNQARVQASAMGQYAMHTTSLFAEAKSPDDYLTIGSHLGSIDLRRSYDELLELSDITAYTTTGEIQVHLLGKGNVDKAVSDDVWLSLHDMYVDGSLQFSTSEVYIDLWDRYLEASGLEVNSRQQKLAALQGWSSWAAQEQGLNQQQLQLCSGPSKQVLIHKRASVGGTRFRIEELDYTQGSHRQKPTVASYMLMIINRSAADGDDGQQEDYVEYELGRAQAFLEVMPPGCSSDEDKQQVVQLKWLRVPEPSFTTRSRLPMVVLDRYQNHPADGFLACLYPLTGVEPCPVALGPIDSLHDVPTPIRLAGPGYPPRNYIPHTVPGSADDVEYCSSVEYAAQR